MIKVGITGGIGSGKSTICGIFQTLGIPVYFADAEAKELYDKDEELKLSIKIHFGETVYSNEKFDRKKMAEIVFQDENKLKLLNQLVHPRIKLLGEKWFESQKTNYAIKEAALLIESGNYKQLDKIILVKSPLALRQKRIMHRDFMSIDEVNRRIEKQSSDEEKEKYADYIINNDEEQALIPQVLRIHNELNQTA
jgi:dephospho-CoA kinase